MLNDSAVVPRYGTVCTEVTEHGAEYLLGEWDTLDEANRAGKDHEVETHGHRWRIESVGGETLTPPFYSVGVSTIPIWQGLLPEPVTATTLATIGAAIVGILKKGIDDLSKDIGEWLKDIESSIENVQRKLEDIIDLLRRLEVKIEVEFETYVRRSLSAEFSTYSDNVAEYVKDPAREEASIRLQLRDVQKAARLAMEYGYAADLTLCVAFRMELDLMLLMDRLDESKRKSCDAYLSHFAKTLDPNMPGSLAQRRRTLEQAVEERRKACPTLREQRTRWPNAVSWTVEDEVVTERSIHRFHTTYQEDFDVIYNGSLADGYTYRVEFLNNVRKGTGTPHHGEDHDDARRRGADAAGVVTGEWNRLSSEYKALRDPLAQLQAAHATVDGFAARLADVRALFVSQDA
jgi:hypothetical protein